MITKFIGMKEFRQNLATYTKNSRLKNIRYIILKKNVPVLEVKPVDEKIIAKEKLKQELIAAYESYKSGEYYTSEEVAKELGLE